VLITILAGSAIALQNSWVQTRITQRLARVLSERFDTSISVGSVHVSLFGKLQLENLLVQDQKQDTLLFSQLVTAKIDTLRIKQKILSFKELNFDENRIKIKRDSANTFNFSFLLDNFDKSPRDSTQGNWNIRCNSFTFRKVSTDYFDSEATPKHRLDINDLNLSISDFSSGDGITQFNITQLELSDENLPPLKEFSGSVRITSDQLEVKDVRMASTLSSIDNALFILDFPNPQDSIQKTANFDFLIGRSQINFRDLGMLVKGVDGMNQVVDLSGRIYGTTNDIKGKNITINTGQVTKAVLDFYINDPYDPENMYLFLDLQESQTSFTDLSNIRLPYRSGREYLEFPEGFSESGLLHFKGNFTGFLSDFVTFGTLDSEMGSLSTDILVAPEKDGTAYYRGNIATSNFDLGVLFNKDFLGKLTFTGSVDGNFNDKENKASGVFKGDIKNVEVNNYTYRDITFDGILLDKMFDGVLAMNDSNLQFSFIGQVDLNSEIPDFDFFLNVKKARLGELNLSDKFPDAEVAFDINAKFSGNRLDNMVGQINLNKGSYKNRNGEMDFGDLSLAIIQSNNEKKLNLTSPYADIEIDGTYHFVSAFYTLEKTFSRFVPSYKVKTPKNSDENDFEFKLNVKEINELANVLVPDLEFQTPFLLYGKLDSKQKNFELEGSIPEIKYKSVFARNIFIGNKIVGDHYSSKFRFGEFRYNDQFRIFNFKIDSRIANNTIDNTISWSNYNELTYSGEISTHTTFSRATSNDHLHIEIEGSPSELLVSDTSWFVSPFRIAIDTSTISIDNLEIRNNDQYLSVAGNIEKGQTDALDVNLRNFQISTLSSYLKQDLELSGVANGKFSFTNLLDKPVILSDLTIDTLYYQDLLIGNVNLVSQWNSNRSVIDSKVSVFRRGKTRLNATGFYEPSTGILNFDTNVDSVSLDVLETFIGGSLTKFTGYGSGKVNIGGTTKKFLMNGALYGANAGLTVDVTQVPYTFNDSVYFRNDTILFDHITIYDPAGNTGTFNGTISHSNFQDSRFDLQFSSDKIIALNTTVHDYDQFYGVAVAKGKLDITGRGRKFDFNASATSLRGTDLKISMEGEGEAEQYEFIDFAKATSVEENNTEPAPTKDESSLIHFVLAAQATPEAKVQLIYNSQIGDIIKAQGEGILVFEMNEEGEIFLSGNYHPTRGDYLFTLRNVINKRFSIQQGGTIVWSGDPYNADIDLTAVYKLKATPYDLLFDSGYDISPNQRIQVECVIHLKDELANPTISFEINTPDAEERLKDELMQYFSNEDDLNKQILSLIVLGKFYTPDYKRGIYDAQNTNMLGTTASELFSNQLSNWLSQINDNWNVGVNYRPGNNITNDEIELALSTQIFNDRVTLNGNIGNNVNQYTSNTSSSQIVGDFEINVKLVPSGKLQFKAYNRSNYNLIYETAPYTQGVGISVTEEYNTFHDLLRKIANLFRKKENKLPTTTQASLTN